MKKIKKRIIAIILTACTLLCMVVFCPIAQASAASIDVSADTQNVYFSNSIPSASAGSCIVNCLGYFVTIKAKDGTTVGTVFIHGNTSAGRSYYSPYDRKTNQLIEINNRPAMETRIPIKDIIVAFGDEYGANTAETVRSIFSKKISGTCSIDSMVCCGKLAGNGVINEKNWCMHSDVKGASFPDIALTQVKLTKDKIKYSEIKEDLRKLNQNPSYDSAKKQTFSCIAINPSINLSAEKNASVLCVNGGFLNKEYQNLTPEKTFVGSTYGSMATDIENGYYGINVALKGGSKPVAEYKPGKVGKIEYSVSEQKTVSKVQDIDSMGIDYTKIILSAIAGASAIFLICLICIMSANKKYCGK